MKSHRNLLVLLILLLALTCDVPVAHAHQPVLERVQTPYYDDILGRNVYPIDDPTQASMAVYGRLNSPDQVDIYSFTADKSETIPVQLLEPVRVSNQGFEPALIIISCNIQVKDSTTLKGNLMPFNVPNGYYAQTLYTNAPWPEFFEPFSFERLYRCAEASIAVSAGCRYYVAIYSPAQRLGDYTLGIGTVEDFSKTPLSLTLQKVGLMKLGLVDTSSIPWYEIWGLFLFLLGIIMSMDALQRRSGHIKLRIWGGYGLAVIGAAIFYRISGTNGVATFQLIMALVILVCNIRVGRIGASKDSPGPPKFSSSAIIAGAGWLIILFFLVWYVLISR